MTRRSEALGCLRAEHSHISIALKVRVGFLERGRGSSSTPFVSGAQRGDGIGWSKDLVYPYIIPFDCVELGKDITAVIKLQDDIKDKGGGTL